MKGTRGDVRAKLYMPTLVAIQYNPAIREFYPRLLKAGKTKMTAVTAYKNSNFEQEVN